MPSPRRPKLLFTINVDWFFLSHRLPLARAARDAGADVYVACTDTGQSHRIEEEGLTYLPLKINRSGTNALQELRPFAALAGLYARVRPDLVHQTTTKVVLYGTLAARLTNPRMPVVNTISGMGYVFTEENRTPGLRRVLGTLYRIGFKRPAVNCIFQNRDDLKTFLDSGLLTREQTALVRGAGVDCSRFRPSDEPTGTPVVMLASRLLWDKGIGEFVEAARSLKRDGIRARFVLVGGSDPDNPAVVAQEQLDEWVREGTIEWWGHRSDMEAVLAECNLFVLPSYREGLPKVLQEAAASQRAIVTTDVPGCREVVQHEKNGLRVPPRNGHALAMAISKLLQEPETRRRMASAGRVIASREFAQEVIVQQTMQVYQRLLLRKGLSLAVP